MNLRALASLLCAALAVTACDDDPASAAADAAASADARVVDAFVGDVEVPAAPSAEVLASRLDLTTFAADLEFIARPRPPGSPHWQAVQDRCAEVFAAAGFTVERHAYGSGVNVIGVRPGTTAPNEWVMISGHYDHIEACAGADDNATGAAGVLEAARALGDQAFERTLAVACWDEEEWGLVGSRAWVDRAMRQGVSVKASYVFEAMGYFVDEPMTQAFPLGFELIFPEAGRFVADRDGRGDFIAALADDLDSTTLADLQAGADRAELPMAAVVLNAGYRMDPSLGDLRRSDHAEFWRAGWPAISLTATANFRNPHYHCTLGEDDIADVDVARTLKVVQAAVFAAATQARPTTGTSQPLDTTTDPAPPVPACDLDAQDCPAGKKCVYTGSGASFTTACQDAGPMGLGDPCTRSPAPSQDDCGPGTFCAFFGQPFGDPQARTCHALCRRDADCAAGQVCAELERTHHVGVCTPPCDPTDPAACGEGQSCLERRSAQPGARVAICHAILPGQRQRGEGCTGQDPCAAGLYCVPAMVNLPAECQPWCADDAGCGDGFYCQFNGVPDRGVCLRR
ncbi:MAG: M20/M25/M40 family metallo-hydrolase [bacterium]